MDKTTFKKEISDYTARGGKFVFAFGDIHFPVIYHEALNMLGVKLPMHEVFVPVDYSRGTFDDNDKEGLEKIAKIIRPLFDTKVAPLKEKLAIVDEYQTLFVTLWTNHISLQQ